VVACPVTGDRPENAARTAWAGAGVSLPRRLVTPRGIRLAVRRVLGNPSFAARAGEMRDWFEAGDPAGRAAAEVEALAARYAGRRVAEDPVASVGEDS
jgi:UDP:flavonoid glycosyltransferase YjiC (YdhE family)